VDVVNEGYRQPPGADGRLAKTADELVQNEALRTEAESAIAVKFDDGSELTRISHRSSADDRSKSDFES